MSSYVLGKHKWELSETTHKILWAWLLYFVEGGRKGAGRESSG